MAAEPGQVGQKRELKGRRKSEILGPSWDARLEEARARRAEALAAKSEAEEPRPLRKPWREATGGLAPALIDEARVKTPVRAPEKTLAVEASLLDEERDDFEAAAAIVAAEVAARGASAAAPSIGLRRFARPVALGLVATVAVAALVPVINAYVMPRPDSASPIGQAASDQQALAAGTSTTASDMPVAAAGEPSSISPEPTAPSVLPREGLVPEPNETVLRSPIETLSFPVELVMARSDTAPPPVGPRRESAPGLAAAPVAPVSVSDPDAPVVAVSPLLDPAGLWSGVLTPGAIPGTAAGDNAVRLAALDTVAERSVTPQGLSAPGREAAIGAQLPPPAAELATPANARTVAPMVVRPTAAAEALPSVTRLLPPPKVVLASSEGGTLRLPAPFLSRPGAVSDAAVEPPAPLSAILGPVVFVHAPAGVTPEAVSETADAIGSATGFAVETTPPVDFKISSTNVRYFHAEDREIAAQVAEQLSARLRDFTSFSPAPDPGTIEVWLAGSSGAVAAAPKPVAAKPATVRRSPVRSQPAKPVFETTTITRTRGPGADQILSSQ